MYNTSYYSEALSLLEEASGIYQTLESEGLHNELYLNLARFALLSGEMQEAEKTPVVIHALIRYRANISQQDRKSRRPIHCYKEEDPQIIELLGGLDD